MLKIKHPIFFVTMPSDDTKISFRPFTVKEEKILLIAAEENTPEAVLSAIKQILVNCVVNPGFKPDLLPLFDLEFLFLHLRSRSVNNVIDITVTDPVDNKEYKIKLDVNDIKVSFDPTHSKKIMLTDNMGLVMKYPTIAMAEKIKDDSLPRDVIYEIMALCIDKVFDGDEVQVAGTDFTKEEAMAFIEDMTKEDFNKLEHFFNTIPILKHELKYVTEAREVKSVTLTGLQDFFQ